MRTLLSNVAAASAVALAASCSLINSFDDVKPQSDDETGGRASSGGSGGADASAGGTSGSGGTSTSGGTTASGGTDSGSSGAGGAEETGGAPATGGALIVDSGPDAFVPGGDGGAIVAFIPTPPTGGRLVVLNPANGASLSSEPMGLVRGIANDVRTDLWYIFELTGTPAEPVKLHVRQLNVDNGKWHEVGTVIGAPHPFSRPQLMNGRLAYLSTPTPAAPDAAAATLTILNVEDPANVLPLGTPQRPLPAGLKQGLLAAPSPSLGGVINVGILAACSQPTDGGVPACDANLVKYSVAGTTVTEGLTKTVGRVLGSGNFVFTLDARGPSAVVGVPADNPPVPQPGCSQNTVDQGSVFKLNMNSLANVGSPVAVPTNSERFQGAAYDTCFDAAFLTTLVADKAIWSAPLAGGAVDKQCQSAGGAGLLIEPYTRTLIRQVQGNGVAPEFYGISGTPSAPRITIKSLPQLPREFAPTIVAVREVDRNRILCPN